MAHAVSIVRRRGLARISTDTAVITVTITVDASALIKWMEMLRGRYSLLLLLLLLMLLQLSGKIVLAKRTSCKLNLVGVIVEETLLLLLLLLLGVAN